MPPFRASALIAPFLLTVFFFLELVKRAHEGRGAVGNGMFLNCSGVESWNV